MSYSLTCRTQTGIKTGVLATSLNIYPVYRFVISVSYFSTVTQRATELTDTTKESGIFGELQSLKAESAATKEELASYKELAEKLQEELLVRHLT